MAPRLGVHLIMLLLLSGCWRTLHYDSGERALTVVCWPEPTCVDSDGNAAGFGCAEARCKVKF
jgi:hypothetical protein